MLHKALPIVIRINTLFLLVNPTVCAVALLSTTTPRMLGSRMHAKRPSMQMGYLCNYAGRCLITSHLTTSLALVHAFLLVPFSSFCFFFLLRELRSRHPSVKEGIEQNRTGLWEGEGGNPNLATSQQIWVSIPRDMHNQLWQSGAQVCGCTTCELLHPGMCRRSYVEHFTGVLEEIATVIRNRCRH